MAREEFIDNLRLASRLLVPPRVSSDQGELAGNRVARLIDSADLWLTPKVVGGFDPADYADWPAEQRDTLKRNVAAFLDIVKEVAPNKRATRDQRRKARKRLEQIIAVVREKLLPEWISAQRKMIDEAIAAARKQGWQVDEDRKDVLESLLGSYSAPRLRIRTPKREVVLDPVALFGSGRQGIVDLVVMPTFQTAYLVTFRNGRWEIRSPRGSGHARPFSEATFVNSITHIADL